MTELERLRHEVAQLRHILVKAGMHLATIPVPTEKEMAIPKVKSLNYCIDKAISIIQSAEMAGGAA